MSNFKVFTAFYSSFGVKFGQGLQLLRHKAVKAVCATKVMGSALFRSWDCSSPAAVSFLTMRQDLHPFSTLWLAEQLSAHNQRSKRTSGKGKEGERACRRTFPSAHISPAACLTDLSGECTVGRKTCHCSETVFSNSVHPCIVINQFLCLWKIQRQENNFDC